MGYSIIFETKIVKLSDGRILHLDRSGCNNDTAGRNRYEFTGTLYTHNEFMAEVNKWLAMPESDSWEMKIGSKQVDRREYGNHLLRMLKRAIPFNDFARERMFNGRRVDGITIISPEYRVVTLDEFDKLWYENKVNSWRRNVTVIETEQEIVSALEQGIPIEFYVGKKIKRIA